MRKHHQSKLLLVVALFLSCDLVPGFTFTFTVSSSLFGRFGGRPSNWQNRGPPSRTTGSLSDAGNALSSRIRVVLQLFRVDHSNSKNGEPAPPIDFFVRRAHKADVGRASEILADGFFKHKTNVFTYQWEKLETFLSLESTFPKPHTMHQLFVACDAKSGRVLGVAEVDAREAGIVPRHVNNSTMTTTPTPEVRDASSINGPYMCNVAVDENFQRRGIATALVRRCETQVQHWHRLSNRTISCSLSLKVRASNQVATQIYSKLGYMSLRQEKNPKTREEVLIMRKELPRPDRTSSCSPLEDHTLPTAEREQVQLVVKSNGSPFAV